MVMAKIGLWLGDVYGQVVNVQEEFEHPTLEVVQEPLKDVVFEVSGKKTI